MQGKGCKWAGIADQIPRLARNRTGHAEQQWQQKLADGIKGRRKDVQTRAGRIGAGKLVKHAVNEVARRGMYERRGRKAQPDLRPEAFSNCLPKH